MLNDKQVYEFVLGEREEFVREVVIEKTNKITVFESRFNVENLSIAA